MMLAAYTPHPQAMSEEQLKAGENETEAKAQVEDAVDEEISEEDLEGFAGGVWGAGLAGAGGGIW